MNLCIMVKKKSYSEEKLNEMIVWLNNHANELPKEMQINKFAFTMIHKFMSTVYKNKRTYNSLSHQI